MPAITLPDGSVRRFDGPVTGTTVAASIGPGLAKAALAMKVDGALMDLSREIEHDGSVVFVTRRDPDALGMIRSANPAAERLSRWSTNELTGMAIDELMPIQARPSGDRSALDLQAMLQLPCNGMATVMTRERQQIEVEISTSPILDKNNGSVSGVAAILRRVESSV